VSIPVQAWILVSVLMSAASQMLSLGSWTSGGHGGLDVGVGIVLVGVGVGMLHSFMREKWGPVGL